MSLLHLFGSECTGNINYRALLILQVCEFYCSKIHCCDYLLKLNFEYYSDSNIHGFYH